MTEVDGVIVAVSVRLFRTLFDPAAVFAELV